MRVERVTDCGLIDDVSISPRLTFMRVAAIVRTALVKTCSVAMMRPGENAVRRTAAPYL
jgi:hypothetical protein